MSGGKASRDKGGRGERRWCAWFEEHGIPARRVGNLEAGTYGKTDGWDLELDGSNPPLRVQAKELAKNCPSPRAMLEKAHIACVHFTEGPYETRDVVMMRADVFKELAAMAAEEEA